MKNTFSLLLKVYLTVLLLLPAISANAQEEVFSQTLQLNDTTGTVYELFQIVTQGTGFLFIYDSEIIDNNRIAHIPQGQYTVKEIIYRITGDNQLRLKLLGKHIILNRHTEEMLPESIPALPPSLIKEATVLDLYSRFPIPYANIQIEGSSIGTITNQNGDFRISVPDSLTHHPLIISHLGYDNYECKVPELNENAIIYLEPKIISLQEVVVRLIHPEKLIKEMLDKRGENYPDKPVYLTSFYREGAERRKGFINMTEGVFKIYKNPFTSPYPDQVQLLKMRKITNRNEKDTLVTKIKAGIHGSLLLDLIKNLPDFLSLNENNHPYLYVHSDIAVIDNRLANVILFEQHPVIKEPLHKGELYIDNETDALLMVRFEINPRYVEKSTSLFVEKKSKHLNLKANKISYTVSYKYWEGAYYINHIRGDLHFTVRKKRSIFNTPLHIWFEMVTCKVEDENVSRFPRQQILLPTTIFSDIHYIYDSEFWGDFNIILPEEKLNESMGKISPKIESIGY